MRRIQELSRDANCKWAIDYLLARASDKRALATLRSNQDFPSLQVAINLLERTDTGRLLIADMQNALRQRRSREVKKHNKSITFTLPQETVSQIIKIAKINNITETDVIAISVMELNEATELHIQQIRAIRATEEQRNIRLKENIRSYEIRLDTALGILEDHIRQLLNKEIITSKPLPSTEEMEKLEEEVRKELDKRMRTARKYIEASGVAYGEHRKNYRY